MKKGFTNVKENFFNTEQGVLMLDLAEALYLLFVAVSFSVKAGYFDMHIERWLTISIVLAGLVNRDKVRRKHDEMVSFIYGKMDGITVKFDHLFIQLLLLVGLMVYMFCGAETTVRVVFVSIAAYYTVITFARILMFRHYDRKGVE